MGRSFEFNRPLISLLMKRFSENEGTNFSIKDLEHLVTIPSDRLHFLGGNYRFGVEPTHNELGMLYLAGCQSGLESVPLWVYTSGNVKVDVPRWNGGSIPYNSVRTYEYIVDLASSMLEISRRALMNSINLYGENSKKSIYDFTCSELARLYVSCSRQGLQTLTIWQGGDPQKNIPVPCLSQAVAELYAPDRLKTARK